MTDIERQPKVKDLELRRNMSVKDLMEMYYHAGGFTGNKLAAGMDILKTMVRDQDCTVFLSFPAAPVSTGTRGVIRELVKRKMVDVVLTTCGTLDHDIARMKGAYYHGDFLMDDVELHEHGINRLGNILVPNEVYGKGLEEWMQPILKELHDSGKTEYGTRELIREFGKRADESTIIHWAYKNQIPIYVPGITDGAFGSQLWMFTQEHRDFRINLFWDENELADIVFTANRTGALMIGGGISKHHTIWWNQFRDGLDYAVFITTAPEYDGSLSGARMREAVSWGKVRADAKYVTIEGDATVLLPLLVAAVL
ncbi:MAG: deoxyhypusine synthase [Thermoplasmata archaeon]|nr:deoxyhypusine synthase [Thermoplasmata archaeon]